MFMYYFSNTELSKLTVFSLGLLTLQYILNRPAKFGGLHCYCCYKSFLCEERKLIQVCRNKIFLNFLFRLPVKKGRSPVRADLSWPSSCCNSQYCEEAGQSWSAEEQHCSTARLMNVAHWDLSHLTSLHSPHRISDNKISLISGNSDYTSQSSLINYCQYEYCN